MNFFASHTEILAAPAGQDADPTAQGPDLDVEVTLLTKADGPLTKCIALDTAGRVMSDGAACTMSQGRATRMRLRDPAELAALIGAMPPDRAIALGRLRGDLPDDLPVVTQRRLAEGRAAQGAIARTRDFIDYITGKPAFALLDHDRKGMPAEVAQTLERHGGFWPALLTVAPDLARAACIRRASTSAGLLNTRTGEPVGTAVASTSTCWCGTAATSSASCGICTSAAGFTASAGIRSARWASCSSAAWLTAWWQRRSAWCSRARRYW